MTFKLTHDLLNQLVEEQAAMSRQEADMYDHAANQDVLLKDLACVGRTWSAMLCDAAEPSRPHHQAAGTHENFRASITRYATIGREGWRKDNPPGTTYAATTPPQVVTQVIEIPADDSEAYESGFNAGLQEGRKLVALVNPAPQTNGEATADELTKLRGELAIVSQNEKSARTASTLLLRENTELHAVVTAISERYIEDLTRAKDVADRAMHRTEVAATHARNIDTMVEGLNNLLSANVAIQGQPDNRDAWHNQAEATIDEIKTEAKRQAKSTVASD